jgi:hypothetical protein
MDVNLRRKEPTMKTSNLRILSAAALAASALAAGSAWAHDGRDYRHERRELRHEHYRHFQPAPRVVVIERPVVIQRQAYVGSRGSVYYTEPAPVYHAEPAPVHYEPRPNWGVVGGAIIGAVIGSQLSR